jgi:hypothetical protein
MANINDMATVFLTPEGREVIRKYYDGEAGREYLDKRIDKRTGKYTTELWHIMHVFGCSVYMGGKQMFKNNEIKIGET